ncbi:MAG: LCP family protein [Ruminococcaceae bacterium]|nr:LCP family protein [Oscillospiraceae bacterium]
MDFEDISSKSDNYVEDEYEDIDTGRYDYDNDDVYEDIPLAKKKQLTDEYIAEKTATSLAPYKTRKKKLKHKLLKELGLAFLVIILCFGIAIFSLINKINNASSKEERINSHITEDELYYSSDVTNILLLGVDAREGETSSRSDTMMLISIDRAHKKIKLTSFLRDSYVEIPGKGWNKLNASCSKGGVNLVCDTIEYNYKIKIDNYMLVNFQAFEKLIDLLGGVDVEITEKEANYLNKTWHRWSLTGNELHFDSGEAVHINGEQALMFCRIRKLDSDFKRTERQRRTISAIKTKLMRSNPIELMNIASKILPLIETDLTLAEITKLGANALFSYLRYDIVSQSIPADGTWHSEMKTCGSSLVFDLKKNTEILKNFIYFDEYDGKTEENTK